MNKEINATVSHRERVSHHCIYRWTQSIN